MDAREAVDAGLYDPSDFVESGQLSALVAGADDKPPDMAVTAARQALRRSGIPADGIDVLIHAAVFVQGPEMWAPHAYIMRELGTGNIPAFEVRQGCNGILAAAELAVGLLHADPSRTTALLTTADNFNSPVINRWQSSALGLVAGDAATATVLSTVTGFATIEAINSAVFPEIEGMTRGDEPLGAGPDGRRDPIDMARRTAQFSSRHLTLQKVVDVIRDAHLQVAWRSLDEVGIDVDGVRRVIYANAARGTVERVMTEPLGVPLSKSTWEYGRRVGHMGASDHLASLEYLLADEALDPGDRVLLVGGAPGWSAASAVLTVNERPGWPADVASGSD
jgi:3-oxoacyl-[acyl-carrier-protein] synthase-3